MVKIRTFIALSISDEAKAAIAQLISNSRDSVTAVRWVKPENMHLTIKFLGVVDEKNLPEIENALTESVKKIEPFHYQLNGTGCFPNCRHPRVLWVGIGESGGSLQHLYENIEERLVKIGLPKEKRNFNPHLTVGRVKDSRKMLPDLSPFLSSSIGELKTEVTEVKLIKSILQPSGARYVPLFAAKF